MIGLPPSDAGVCHETVTRSDPLAVALTLSGALGRLLGVAEVLDDGPVPAALVATTLKEYVVPFVSPVMVVLLVAASTVVFDCCAVPMKVVTTYPVIGEPPVDEGACQDTVACALPATALTFCGALGTVTGVTARDVAVGPVPTTVVAATANVYVVPLVSPEIVVESVVPLTLVAGCAVAPMYGVTVYPVMALPPSDDGVCQETVACAFPAVAVTFCGALAYVHVVVLFDAADAAPV